MKKKTLALLVLLTGCASTYSAEIIEPPPVVEEGTPPPPSFPPQPCTETERTDNAGEPVVYAHAALLAPDASGQRAWTNWLAVFDPKTLSVREWISLESCKDGLLDMAVDRKGRIFFAGANGYFWFDVKTKTCTRIKGAHEDPNGNVHYVNAPNNLTFAPAELFVPGASPETEVLVGFGSKLKDDTDLKSGEPGFVRIDPDTAEMTVVNPWIANSPAWQLWPSGDLVSVVDRCKKTAVTWATVIGNKEKSLCRACEEGMKPGLDCGDCLYELDMKTGTFGKELGLLPYDGVFGLTFWGGVLVGFNFKGKIFTIDPSVSPPTTKELPFTAPPNVEQVSFMGAGSTTIAPLGAVK
jgi:hypothetical protein